MTKVCHVVTVSMVSRCDGVFIVDHGISRLTTQNAAVVDCSVHEDDNGVFVMQNF